MKLAHKGNLENKQWRESYLVKGKEKEGEGS